MGSPCIEGTTRDLAPLVQGQPRRLAAHSDHRLQRANRLHTRQRVCDGHAGQLVWRPEADIVDAPRCTGGVHKTELGADAAFSVRRAVRCTRMSTLSIRQAGVGVVLGVPSGAAGQGATNAAGSVVDADAHPLEMRALFAAPDRDPVDALAWAIATTGMHAAELWGR